MQLAKLTRFMPFLNKLFKIYFIMLIIAIAAGFYELYTKVNLPSDIDFSAALLPSDIITGIIGIVQFVLVLILFINYLRWIYKVNIILASKESGLLKYTPGLSVGYYFIPILNLFRPYQVLKNYWQIIFKNENTDYSIIKWWWALWLFSNFIGRIAFKYTMSHLDSNNDYCSTVIYLISDSIDFILYIMMFKIVNTLSEKLIQKYDGV
jgi:hypothetical protein